MATHIYKGTPNPKLQRYTGKYDPISGFTYDQEFRGLDPKLMQSLANAYANAGCSYELTVAFGVATLRTTDNRGNITLDTWEIGVNQILESSLKNPRNIAGVNSVDDMLTLAKFIRGELSYDEALPLLDGGNTWTTALIERLNQGSDSYFTDQYTLRHTTNVSNRWAFNVADFNKNCIYTPAQFYSEVQNSNDWIFPMPNAFVNVLTSNAAPAAPAGYTWGYLKSGSPRSTAANNRSNIVTEYKQFLWSNYEYSTI